MVYSPKDPHGRPQGLEGPRVVGLHTEPRVHSHTDVDTMHAVLCIRLPRFETVLDVLGTLWYFVEQQVSVFGINQISRWLGPV